MEHKISSVITPLLTALALAASSVNAAQVYRWVDENGEVHYSESLPPDYQDKGHDVLNQQGMVVDEDLKLTPEPPPEVPDEETPQELPRDSSGLPRPKALYSEAEMQNRMDNFLMLRYDSEQEILDAMSVEIKQLDYDRRLLETSRTSMQEAYRGQIREAANRQRAGEQVDSSIGREIGALQTRLAKNGQELSALNIREKSIKEDFDKQLKRYRFLVEEWAEESADS